MTSNTSKTDIDKLDPALIRPGRVDLYHTLDVPYIVS
jgi:ATP-dependent 26S proteasome regulatory subunit